MQKIIPCLWYDDAGEDAAALYISALGGAVKDVVRYPIETPGRKPVGSVMMVGFEAGGMEFLALNGGTMFKPNPSISFFVKRQSAAEVEAVWNRLAEGGTVLMPLGAYPFSEKFGWLQDKYGVSWQVNLCSDAPGVSPFLMFTGAQNGRAAEAAAFYTGLLPDSAVGSVSTFGDAAGPANDPGDAMNVSFTLAGQDFMAMDGGGGDMHKFGFDEGLSLMIMCDTQAEVDRLWDAITADGGQESVCGWCKDKFGVSWQVTPRALMDMNSDPDREKAARAMAAMMEMGKIDIAAVERAYRG